MSISREMGKEDAVHLSSGISLHHETERMAPLAAAWTNPEMIPFKQVRQRGEISSDTHYMWSLKRNRPNEIRKQKRRFTGLREPPWLLGDGWGNG